MPELNFKKMQKYLVVAGATPGSLITVFLNCPNNPRWIDREAPHAGNEIILLPLIMDSDFEITVQVYKYADGYDEHTINISDWKGMEHWIDIKQGFVKSKRAYATAMSELEQRHREELNKHDIQEPNSMYASHLLAEHMTARAEMLERQRNETLIVRQRYA